MFHQPTDGLIAALFTPFQEDGRINFKLFPDLITHLIETGHEGIFACGTNGEGPSMTISERKNVSETVVSCANGRVKTIVHVGHASIAEARTLARHAEEVGADAISSVAAFYFRPTSTANLVDCMAEIASAAPTLPFYYYHIPTLINVSIDILEFIRLAEERIENFAGLKFTATNLWEYQSCLSYQKNLYDVMYGFDENHLAALAVGAKGFIGSTFCFAAPLYLQVRSLFEQGRLEEARVLMQQIVDIVLAIVKYPAIPAQKAVMKMIGFDMGGCRLPLAALNTTQELLLKEKLGTLGFFELLSTASA